MYTSVFGEKDYKMNSNTCIHQNRNHSEEPELMEDRKRKEVYVPFYPLDPQVRYHQLGRVNPEL